MKKSKLYLKVKIINFKFCFLLFGLQNRHTPQTINLHSSFHPNQKQTTERKEEKIEKEKERKRKGKKKGKINLSDLKSQDRTKSRRKAKAIERKSVLVIYRKRYQVISRKKNF